MNLNLYDLKNELVGLTAEQHVLEDYKMKFIPAASDFLTKIPFADWMQNGQGGYPDSYSELQKNNKKPVEIVEKEKTPDTHIRGFRNPGTFLVD